MPHHPPSPSRHRPEPAVARLAGVANLAAQGKPQPWSRRQFVSGLLASLGPGAGLAAPASTAAPTAPLLAREWPADADPAGYLVSEKLDGVRALWDGRQLRFRSGRPIAAPASFLRALPDHPLDGELWLGRGRFEALSGLVRRTQPEAADWSAVQYQVFEWPGMGGRFASRAAALQAQYGPARPGRPVQAVAQQAVPDRPALARLLQDVVDAGGEGLMLHRADAPEAAGRGPWLYKHKPLHDAEAVVLAHLPGQGRFSGQMGALQVRTDTGAVLAIGTGFDDADRARPPAPGERITFTHRGYTAGGLPRFASYLRRSHGL